MDATFFLGFAMENLSIGEDLLIRLRSGDPAAVTDFVDRYKEQVCRQTRITLRHSIARTNGDTFQTMVESMFNSVLHRLITKIREGELDCDLRPVAYMSRMIQNRWLNQKRKEDRHKHEAVENLDTLRVSDSLPDDVVAETELVEKYARLMGELTEWEQSLVKFRLNEQLPYSEISKVLFVSEHVLRARFADVVKKLRKLGGDV